MKAVILLLLIKWPLCVGQYDYPLSRDYVDNVESSYPPSGYWEEALETHAAMILRDRGKGSIGLCFKMTTILMLSIMLAKADLNMLNESS